MDGIGGIIFLGLVYVNSGVFDGEVVYLMGSIKKWYFFWGGVSVIVVEKIFFLEEFVKRFDEEFFVKVWEVMKDGFVKVVVSELVVVGDVREIIFFGRLMCIDEFRKDVEDFFEEYFDFLVVK